MENYFNAKNKYFCCGCTACKFSCPQQAISMAIDDEGFEYPEIDITKCTNCNICRKVCPFNENFQKQSLELVYAVKNANEDIREVSSSGGIFTAISDWILDNKGIVYGAMYDKNFDVVHGRATTKEERNQFRGSKYVQSRLDDIFVQVKEDLSNNKYVLFTGTPCQSAGLKSYIGNKTDSHRLILCDLVCHGVPSAKIFKEYLAFMEKKAGKKIKHINFRDKKSGWHSSELKIIFHDNDSISENLKEGIYYKLYFNRLIVRPSCNKCFFADFNRVSDITIADFWGIEKSLPQFDDDKGISLVLINSKKGEDLFEKIKSNIVYMESNKSDCLQPQLKGPANESVSRNKFWKEYRKKGFLYVIKNYTPYGDRFLSVRVKRLASKVYNKLFAIFKRIAKTLIPNLLQ